MRSSDRPLSGFEGEAAYRIAGVPPLPGPLADLLREGRMLHAVLLEGQSAPERLETALALAGAILCEAGRDAMCQRCRACRLVLSASHPDLILCNPAADSDCYKKGPLRELRSAAWQHPVEGSSKVFILHEAQR